MRTIAPEFYHGFAPFLSKPYWEELRPDWEDRSATSIPAQNAQARNEDLKFSAEVMGIQLPDDLIAEFDRVQSVLAPLQLVDDGPLGASLFEIAGRYLLPRDRKFWGANA